MSNISNGTFQDITFIFYPVQNVNINTALKLIFREYIGVDLSKLW